MRQLVGITYNGKTFSAYPGDVLLDAALRAGVGMPHDCRSGLCEACVVRILSGETEGGEGAGLEPGMVLACQARVLSDVEAEAEVLQAPSTCQATITEVSKLSESVFEIAVVGSQQLVFRPGQYVQAVFEGLPRRPLVPTRPLDAAGTDGLMRFHIECRHKGLLSSRLRQSITVGHRVDITGPFGSAYLRRGLQDRLVLIAAGTGFASIWAIADAALRERPQRTILLFVGARKLKDLYMVKSLGMMATCPNVSIVVTCEERQTLSPVILAGRPTDYMPPLLLRDIIFAAGPAELVDAVREAAAASGAAFNGEAFLPAGEEDSRGWLSRVLSRAGSGITDAPVKVPSRTPVSLQPHLSALPRSGQLAGPQLGPAVSLRIPPQSGTARLGSTQR